MNLDQWINTDLGKEIWHKKYQVGDETFEEWLDRVSNHNEQVKQLIRERKFLFGGRILAARGVTDRKVTYSNCYVLPQVGDSIEDIYDTAKYLARTFSYGGGCGIDISLLRPKGSPVNNAAMTTTGAVSFMETFNNVSQTIGQKGRRGALMISMDVNHAEIEDFINAKNANAKLEECNISVRADSAFMTKVIEGDENATQLMQTLARNNWNWGEPGMLFWDNINKHTLLSEYIKKGEFQFAGVNPCVTGDTLVQTIEGAIPIKHLVGTQPYVYCMNEEGELTIKQATKVWKTRENAKLVEIDFDRGKLICTPDHLILTRNRGWVKAIELNPNMDIVNGFKYINITQDSKAWSIKKVTILDYTEDVYDLTVPYFHNFIANDIVIHNCAEEPLPPGGSCLLGALNLSEFVNDPFGKKPAFNLPEFRKAVNIAVEALNEVLDEGLKLHPLPIQRESVGDWRQIGLGIMGFADALVKLRIPYGSKRCMNLINVIGKELVNTGLQQSAILASKDGSFAKYNKDYILNSTFIKRGCITEKTKDLIKLYGLRNSQLFTIAPTGSIGTMLGVSTGVEPIYDVNGYTRTTKSLQDEETTYTEYPGIIQQAILADDINMTTDKPAYIVGAKDLDFLERVTTQATWQKWIDASISSTVNLPVDATVDDVFKLYVAAHELGCKGVTVFRDGCKKAGILNGNTQSKDTPPVEVPDIAIHLEDTDIDHCVAMGSKLQTGCGSLWMTVYFNPLTGKLCHIFLNKGSSGGCNSYMVGLSRLISLAGKRGATVEEIIDQLESVVACPSYVKRKWSIGDTSAGKCCPEAIGKELKVLYKRFKKSFMNNTVIEDNNEESQTYEVAKCPECGEDLSFMGGCVSCTNCGFSKCD